jgi:protein-S-isoprenylcysteine O-methyltransferase Ste14
MSYLTALVIFIFCTVLAVVVCAPFIYIARRRRSRRVARDQIHPGKRLSLAQATASLAMVAVLFFAFAHQYIAPDGWLGTRVRTGEGRFWLMVLLLLIAAVVGYWWRILQSHIRRAAK